MEDKTIAPVQNKETEAIKPQDKGTDIREKIQEYPAVFRVGDKFFETVQRYDIKGKGYIAFEIRRRETIVDKYGRDFIKTIHSYDAAVIVPSHLAFQQIVGNCWNLYERLEASPREGEHKTWDKMMKHIFGEMVELGWDYLALMYREPTQVLPVLALVSKENQTGKTTFGMALSFLFGRNVGFFSQSDLSSQFNVWIKHLVAVFEEISDTKSTLNKIKDVSTAQMATLNEKYQPQVSFQPFVKIVIFSNNDRDFIKANEHDIRYWILRLHPFSREDFDPDFNKKLYQEVPAVMHTLVSRKLSTECKSRMWFDPSLLKTEALEEVIEHSQSEAAKEIRIWSEEVLEKMSGFGANITDVYEALNHRYSRNEIKRALKEELKLPTKRTSYKSPDGLPHNGQAYFFGSGEEIDDLPENWPPF